MARASLDEWSDRAGAWEISGSNKEFGYLTHGIFRFYGKFPPPVAERFIRELHKAVDGPVLDPTVGSGTTAIEAMRLKRDMIGIDVNPLFVMVSRVKTTYVSPEILREKLGELELLYRKDHASDNKFIPKDRNLSHWFYEETQKEIARVRGGIESLALSPDELAVKEFFLVALAACIRQFSRASRGMGRMFLDPALKPPDVLGIYSKKAREMILAVSGLEGLGPKPDLRVGVADKTELPAESVGLVVCHPPYFNLYRYSSVYKYEQLWLGYDFRGVRRQEITEGFKLARKELVENYVHDMLNVLLEARRVLKIGRRCVLLVGDTVIQGEHIPVTSRLLRSIPAKAYEVERLLIRIPKYTEASYSAAQRRDKSKVGVKMPDHLLVLRKL
ncbi:MAG: hypothetical protein JRN62_09515 [Nitrososphaerota archaeon]|nr:hypothetical protein [Nitrososphaerota archaeon]